MKIKNSDMLVGLLVVAFCLFVLHEIQQFSSSAERIRSLGPEVFPNVLASAMGFLGALLVIRSLREPAGPLLPKVFREHSAFPACMVLLGVICFMLVVVQVGFIVWSLVFLAAMQYVLGARNKAHILGLSVLITAAMYVLFVLCLKIPLPTGELW